MKIVVIALSLTILTSSTALASWNKQDKWSHNPDGMSYGSPLSGGYYKNESTGSTYGSQFTAGDY